MKLCMFHIAASRLRKVIEVTYWIAHTIFNKNDNVVVLVLYKVLNLTKNLITLAGLNII